MKVHDVTVKGYYFQGWVYKTDLPELVQSLFSFETETVDVEGEFHIEWDDDIVQVYIDYVMTTQDQVFHELQVDIDNLQEVIENDSDRQHDWLVDKISSAADSYYEGDR